MCAASPPESSYLNPASVRSRLVAFCLAFAISLLIVVMLLRLGISPARLIERKSSPITVELLPEAGSARPQPRTTSRPKAAAVKIPPPVPSPVPTPLKMLVMSSEEFAMSDIAKLPSQARSGSGDGDTGASDAEGAGEGPGGQRLYNAEWYREPTRAELATYLPAGRSDAQWGMIACRTAPQFRVEDCQEMAESPVGSGLARALRQASWQFRVRPPRIGGKSMVGAWVRIRFYFTRDAAG